MKETNIKSKRLNKSPIILNLNQKYQYKLVICFFYFWNRQCASWWIKRQRSYQWLLMSCSNTSGTNLMGLPVAKDRTTWGWKWNRHTCFNLWLHKDTHTRKHQNAKFQWCLGDSRETTSYFENCQIKGNDQAFMLPSLQQLNLRITQLVRKSSCLENNLANN